MSKLFTLGGLIAATLAVVGAPVAYALSWHEVTVLLLALPGAAAVVVALDIHRRMVGLTRRSQRWQQDVDRRIADLKAEPEPRARADAASQEDLLGTVRVIQAQYEGRLDRAQDSLDEAVRGLRAQLDASVPPASSADSDEAKQAE